MLTRTATGWRIRVCVPGAEAVHLLDGGNRWSTTAVPMRPDSSEMWVITVAREPDLGSLAFFVRRPGGVTGEIYRATELPPRTSAQRNATGNA